MNILFLCTGNACRSQIAEAWARKLAPANVRIQSAGIEAHGKNPRAIAVMREVGIDMSQQNSTVVSGEMLAATDYLITVCGHADERCPATPGGIRKAHWPLSDPAKATGSDELIMRTFRETREEIRERVVDLLQQLENDASD